MMMRQTLIKAAKNYIYQLDDFSEKAVIEQIKEELQDILSFNDNGVLEKRLKYIGIGKKEDYLNRFIKTSEGTVLAGIRHMGETRKNRLSICGQDLKYKMCIRL